MLRASHPFGLFDYFRVPYLLGTDSAADDLGAIDGGAARVHWPLETRGAPGLWSVGGSLFFTWVASRAELRAWELALGGAWEDAAELRNADTAHSSAVRRRGDGTLLLPFDPAHAMESAWSEAYRSGPSGSRSRLRRGAMSGYYAVRPVLPRRLQLALRRSFSHLQRRASFPRWPVESGLHDLYERLFGWIAEATGGPVPGIAPWPGGATWALVLTHDVEHRAGYDAMERLQTIEQEIGYRSAWYLVPERDYAVDAARVAALQAAGFEVGVHGLHHDGRDLVRSVLPDRLGRIQAWRDRWNAAGFRSPATHRDWELMPTLGFVYDSSSFDTDPFEPQSGGCCTWLPFHNRGTVELPLTLTMDHTVFVILRRDASAWEEKADYLRDQGGMALLLTHPDYMLEADRLAAYRRFLQRYADDATAWRALPSEVAEWWNRRAASSVVETADGSFAVQGPAAGEARIVELG